MIGHPVAHSRSPAMQRAAFDALGLAARYELWDTAPDDLPARVASLRARGMLGANVTIPYKLSVMSLLDRMAPAAEQVAGAVNTIVRERAGGRVRLVGYNTDIAGLEALLLEAGTWPTGRRVLVLGAGGTARAVVGLAAREGAAELMVAARRVDQALEVLGATQAAQALGGQPPRSIMGMALTDAGMLAMALASCDLLVNTTPVGTGDPDASPIPLELLARLPHGACVLDVIYAPPETALVRAARAAGHTARGGLTMLLHQGAAAFELWTGHAAPLAAMRAALAASLAAGE
ncbi:MAG TPA: shikimate dehydrogenase [Ktedonobacterales bacterium]